MPSGTWVSSAGPKTIIVAAIAAAVGGLSVSGAEEPETETLAAEPEVYEDVFGAFLGAESGVPAQVDPTGLGLGTFRATQNILQGRLERRWVQAAGGSPAPGTLLWPVETGTFGRGFGSGSGHYHQAVDIAAPVGTEMAAAADGLVGYAGDMLTSYGNAVLIVHPGGWVTLYAHAEELMVSTGEMVSRGQIIALVGDTGISRGPHLHFELIHDGKVCDPLPLFRPGPTRGGGRPIATPIVWEEVGRPPRELRCAERVHHPNSQWYPTP